MTPVLLLLLLSLQGGSTTPEAAVVLSDRWQGILNPLLLLLPPPPLLLLLSLQGGSMTPEAAVVLSDLRRRGAIDVCEECEVLDATWDWTQQRWDVWVQVRGGVTSSAKPEAVCGGVVYWEIWLRGE
jgi:hypothetical protein